jgi:hypothetical protein
MGKAMKQHRMQTRIGGKHLKGVACRRVAFEDAQHILFYSVKHQGIPGQLLTSELYPI